MRLDSRDTRFLVVDETASTQALAAELLLAGQAPAVVFAHHQTRGRGRHGRPWLSARDDSLTMSLVFESYADHPMPWLLGMAVACAAAGALHCQVQWPNDLVLRGKKLGGILTELLPDAAGRRIPVTGVGVNLNQQGFEGDIVDTAISLRMAHDESASGIDSRFDALTIAREIVERVHHFPEVAAWPDLRPIWELFDASESKTYRLADGRSATAIGFGPSGELLASADGEPVLVHAADALWGAAASV